MNKIKKADLKANLPQDGPALHERRRLDPVAAYAGLCAQILRDPVSSPADKMRAMEGLLRRMPEPVPTAEQLAREELRQMSTEQLDEVLGILTTPLGARDLRELERELSAARRHLEAEFEARVEARVRELVRVTEVEARIECRPRETQEVERPIQAAENGRGESALRRQDLHVVNWPPDRCRQGGRRLGSSH